MKKASLTALFFLCLVLFLTTGIGISAQDVLGVGVEYEYMPYVKFTDSSLENVEIRQNTWSIGAAWPISIRDGDTLILNSVRYQRSDFEYKGWQSWMGNKPSQVHLISYSFFLMQALTPQWKLILFMEPGIASDMAAALSSNDITFTGALGASRRPAAHAYILCDYEKQERNNYEI